MGLFAFERMRRLEAEKRQGEKKPAAATKEPPTKKKSGAKK